LELFGHRRNPVHRDKKIGHEEIAGNFAKQMLASWIVSRELVE
jgi:hypothetical protein